MVLAFRYHYIQSGIKMVYADLRSHINNFCTGLKNHSFLLILDIDDDPETVD
jgi:hypothetical protein